jgi:hypothetical protein
VSTGASPGTANGSGTASAPSAATGTSVDAPKNTYEPPRATNADAQALKKISSDPRAQYQLDMLNWAIKNGDAGAARDHLDRVRDLVGKDHPELQRLEQKVNDLSSRPSRFPAQPIVGTPIGDAYDKLGQQLPLTTSQAKYHWAEAQKALQRGDYEFAMHHLYKVGHYEGLESKADGDGAKAAYYGLLDLVQKRVD